MIRTNAFVVLIIYWYKPVSTGVSYVSDNQASKTPDITIPMLTDTNQIKQNQLVPPSQNASELSSEKQQS